MTLDIYLIFLVSLKNYKPIAGREARGERLEGSGEGGLQGRGEGARPRQDHRGGPGPGKNGGTKYLGKIFQKKYI